MNMVTNPPKNPTKLQLEIFVPLSACACVYQHYLDRVFAVLLPYKHLISFQVKNAVGAEADKYGIFQNTVVVNGREKFTRITDLEDYLKRTFGDTSLKD